MDFRRIDKNTVQCILSEDEMNAYGFKIEDLFSDQQKSHEFLEHIVERAQEEIGYQSNGGMVSMQIMRMPNRDLVLTFSDRGDKEGDIQNMIQHIQQMAGMLDEQTANNMVDQLTDGLDTAATDNMPKEVSEEEYQQHMLEVEQKKAEKEKKQLSAPRVFCFDSLNDIENFAKSCTLQKNINSSVYKDEQQQQYYLLVKKGRLKLEEYKLLCQQISEFAKLGSQQIYVEQYCKEHFDKLIAKQAIQVLRNI